MYTPALSVIIELMSIYIFSKALSLPIVAFVRGQVVRERNNVKTLIIRSRGVREIIKRLSAQIEL